MVNKYIFRIIIIGIFLVMTLDERLPLNIPNIYPKYAVFPSGVQTNSTTEDGEWGLTGAGKNANSPVQAVKHEVGPVVDEVERPVCRLRREAALLAVQVWFRNRLLAAEERGPPLRALCAGTRS